MNAYKSALQWHSLGISTIPILYGKKVPALQSWRQYQTVLPTARELSIWFENTEYNIAVITGHQGLVIIDFDDALAYSAWLCRLNGNFMATSQTYRVRTSRGYHYYYYCDDDVNEWHGDGVDVKARGYCLCPPSLHPSGTRYVPIGSPHNIQHIDNIRDILPAYRPEQPKWTPPQRDIYDDAMRIHVPIGTSISDIKMRIRIEDVIGLRHTGRRQSIRCPFPRHEDTHASFVIYPDGQWHCYGGCGHGDVIDYWAQLNNISLSDAMRELARKAGI